MKFTRVPTVHDIHPSIPRSCPGTCVRDGVIQCKPPKLTDTGIYNVSIALNGKDFITESYLNVDIFPDPVIVCLNYPFIVDTRREDTEKITISLVS